MPSKRRVIFLDFDGVVNHPGIYRAIEEKYGTGSEADWHNFRESEWLDPKLVAKVGQLAIETGSLIAVISSWRQRFDGPTLRAILRERGLPQEVRVNKCAHNCSKGEALDLYLKAQRRRGTPVDEWVVLDDSIGDLGELTPPRRWVRTSGAVGVTDADLEQVRRVLGFRSRRF